MTPGGLMTGLTQDPYVFQASVRDNLRLAGPEASEEELAAAVRERGWSGGWSGPGGTPCWARTGGRCPAGSCSGWRWPGRC